MTSLTTLLRTARPEAVALARAVLEQDAADQAWAEQVGPALTQRDTARLLGKTEQAVAKDARLLRVRGRDGRPVYPVLQFDGRAQVTGLAEVVAALRDSVQPLTIASFLTGQHRALDGRRPVDALRAGEHAAVLLVAQRFARAAA